MLFRSGVQITDTEGPILEISDIISSQEQLNFSYVTDNSAVKIECYLDGYFLGLQTVQETAGTVTFANTLSHNFQELKIIVYDRFLNQTIYQ